jgi:hypothetical protein
MRKALALLLVIAATRSAGAAPEEPPAEPPAEEPPAEEPPPEEDSPVILIERIDITGNTATQAEIIRRALPIRVGEVLYADDPRLNDLRFKVLALGYFRTVAVAMKKGKERGQIVIKIDVSERGTIALNRLWFGHNSLSPWWFGADVTERNLLGLGIVVGGGFIYAAHGDVTNSRDQWAGEVRAGDASLLGSRWGLNGSLTLVHGSEPYRVSGADDDTSPSDAERVPCRRFALRGGVTADATALTRISASLRRWRGDQRPPPASRRARTQTHRTAA